MYVAETFTRFLSFSVVALLIEKRFAFLKALEGSPTKKAPPQNFTPPKSQNSVKTQPKKYQTTIKK